MALNLKPKELILAPRSLDLFITLGSEPKKQECVVNRRLLVNSLCVGRCFTLSFIKVFSYLSVIQSLYDTSELILVSFFYAGKRRCQKVKNLHTLNH